jgi:hypothetical protein
VSPQPFFDARAADSTARISKSTLDAAREVVQYHADRRNRGSPFPRQAAVPLACGALRHRRDAADVAFAADGRLVMSYCYAAALSINS